ncbi:sigma-70 family RNA polymerase sigma factor [Corynebacterium pseudodiphtheriticum]|uniref:sigma-70 family RNA polymerase sigma factor n=1 Tax=Corynebacterium pseudodiphtheriticum TaxID=37637 RepID=UPI00234CD546|nr:sigma-70 family RNA polymerase sigma factor [Corynebacterium pseudodiphtheriticum]MDC7111562.1 sigma-70 family RNA polymerase sigma factor [Corynebacterium pseudodiphtheriticum]MDC7115547.1 sigma-70 family RNA polymerase sigma factor [Corynebacterium pseudodiphtheriticum]
MSSCSPEEHARLDSLVAGVASGDQHAFAQLYDALSPLAFGVIIQVLGDNSLAEEVLQEVFVEVWNKAGSFDPERGHARTWVGRIAHSRGIDRLRAHNASVRRDDAEFVLGERIRSIDVENEALANVEGKRLRAAVDTIGEPHRTAVLLTFFDGLSHAELAETTNVPLGTAKTRVRDGVRKLAAVWGRGEAHHE